MGKVFLACHEDDTHAIINEGPPEKHTPQGGQFGHPCSERPWNPGAHILVIPTNTKHHIGKLEYCMGCATVIPSFRLIPHGLIWGCRMNSYDDIHPSGVFHSMGTSSKFEGHLAHTRAKSLP